MKTPNKLLSNSTFLNSTGDFVVFFSLLNYLNISTQNIYIAAYGVSVKSIGIALGAFVFPFLGNYIPVKKLLVSSIALNNLILIVLWYFVNQKYPSLAILIAMALVSFTIQIFSGVRESYSRTLGDIPEQRGLQAQILSSFYGAQLLGPILGFFIGLYSTPAIGILIAFILNLMSIFSLLKLPSQTKRFSGANILRPFLYLRWNKPLTHILIMRSVLQWIPIGLFNFLMFPVVEKKYELNGIYSAWIYVVIGIGSIFAAFVTKPDLFLRYPLAQHIIKKISSMKDFELAFTAMVLLSLTRFSMVIVPNLESFLLIGLIGGFANGLNAVSTQTIRRKLCDSRQHPEIIGLEVIFGRITDWVVGTVCVYGITQNVFDYKTGVVVSGIILLILAIMIRNKTFHV